MNAQKSILISMGLLILLGFVLESCSKPPEIDWGTYTDREKLYKLGYPPGWKVAVNGHTFTVTPPDATGSLSATAYEEVQNKEFDMEAFKTMVMKDFLECRVTKPFKPIKGGNWVGQEAEYEGINHGERISWVFRVVIRGKVGVFLAVNEMRIHMKGRLPTYRQIMDSLVILSPPPTPIPDQKPPTPAPYEKKSKVSSFWSFLKNEK